jgi:hypothetical protein
VTTSFVSTNNRGKKTWYPSVSYKIWSEFVPPIGQEYLHCDMKRGFTRVRQREPHIATLLKQDNIAQRIGHLAQRGVYELHNAPYLLSQSDGIDRVVQILQLDDEAIEVREKVLSILKSYYQQPILANKNILCFNKGDEGIPDPILIDRGAYKFQLYVVMDCVFIEPDRTIHILDFKTGTSKFDSRQLYVYLLAAQYLYPNQKAVASFYNLETHQWSKPIAASDEAIESIEIELNLIAKRRQKEINQYRENFQDFQDIFSPNPGIACRYCSFQSVCKFFINEVSE